MALENQEMNLKIFCKPIIVTASFRSNFKVEMEGMEDQALLDRLVKQVIPGQVDRQVLLVSSSCKSTSRSKISPWPYNKHEVNLRHDIHVGVLQ